MVAWPGTLPQSPLVAGYSEEMPELTVRSQPDMGPAKVRRRFTAGVVKVMWSMQMTTAQLATLETFYVTTTEGGAIRFTHTNAITGAAKDYRFAKPYKKVPLTHDLFQVDLELEQMP